MLQKLWTTIVGVAINLALTNQTTRAESPTTAAGEAVACFPSDGANAACIDTPLQLTFSAPPAAKAGMVRLLDAVDHSMVIAIDVTQKVAMQSIGGLPNFNYRPIVISENVATIVLPIGTLKYGKTYSVSVDAGAFEIAAGDTAKIDWQFTTRPAPPTSGAAKVDVAADGSGDFCTLQGALDFIPDGNTNRTTIFIHNGDYPGLIFFENKHNLTITGEDRKKTIIEYANNNVFNSAFDRHIYHRGVFLAQNCNGLVINNLTMRNTTPRGGSQAETVILNGDGKSRAILSNLDLYSFQDTLQINGQAYIKNCYIEGDVDFMWGKGPCFFEMCHCFGTRSKAYYAQIRNPATNHGFIYHRCTFDGPPGVTGMFLNRIAPSGYPNSEMVLLDCTLGEAVSPVGWLLNAVSRGVSTAPAPTTAPDVHFWESNSVDVSGKPNDVSKRLAVSRQLDPKDDAELISHYSKPSFVLEDGWDAESDPNLPKDIGSR